MAIPRTKLFVGHLPDGCTNDDLFGLFSKYGKVTECDVIHKYGFVHMSTSEEAEDALKALNNFFFKGSSLSVEPSKSKLHPEPGSQGRARGGSNRGRGGGGGGGYGYSGGFNGSPRGSYANGYRRFDGPVFGGGRDYYPDRGYSPMVQRMRPYPSPYDRPALSMGLSSRDDYGYAANSSLYRYRSSPYSMPSRDPYSRTSLGMSPTVRSPRDLYERRPTSYPTASDYLYSRRSPSHSDLNRAYWYSDSLGESQRLSAGMSRRPYF